MSTASVGQHRERCAHSSKLLRRAFLWLHRCGRNHRERQGIEEELLVLLSVRPGPLGSGFFPRELPAFLALDPLVFADLLFDEVGDPVEGIGLHHRRNRDVLLDF